MILERNAHQNTAWIYGVGNKLLSRDISSCSHENNNKMRVVKPVVS